VQFIGMMPADPPSDWIAPDYFRELEGGHPVVHVTQGTLANESPQLIRPALEGLAGEPVLVVVSTGGRPIEQLGVGPLPANARISTYLSYPELLPRTAVMVTNGGYGGVQTALSYGVPLVVAGATEDKPEVAMRVAWSGAGINLKTATPTPDQVRNAVRAVLGDPRYRERARTLSAEYARYHAVQRAVQLVEDLIDRKAAELGASRLGPAGSSRNDRASSQRPQHALR
jgi:MGT family glycosyltransferase